LAPVSVLAHEDVGVADLVGAATLVLSQAALDALTARAGGGSTGSKEAAAAEAPKAAAKGAGSKAPVEGDSPGGDEV
ncbi:MAG: hypothetical protein ACRDLF_09395, partial [Solirubrobacteraceae bacterium]